MIHIFILFSSEFHEFAGNKIFSTIRNYGTQNLQKKDVSHTNEWEHRTHLTYAVVELCAFLHCTNSQSHKCKMKCFLRLILFLMLHVEMMN